MDGRQGRSLGGGSVLCCAGMSGRSSWQSDRLVEAAEVVGAARGVVGTLDQPRRMRDPPKHSAELSDDEGGFPVTSMRCAL